MESHVNPLNRAVVFLFGNQMAALWISAALLLLCAIIIVSNFVRFHHPLSAALRQRVGVLQPVLEAEGSDTASRHFADRFDEIDGAMIAPGRESQELRLAWYQFRETILDETEIPMRSTMRADSYFLHLGDDTRVLAWWANIFVALGLTFTFLGIVAALTKTVTMLSSASGSANMTPALIGLLTITSVKFWTSIAGVLASIVLRSFDRRWHSSNQRSLECIVDALDRGTLFSPPQRIAAEQLREIKQQTTALKSFSHELAIAIGENLERQMQPMVQVLGGIHSSIDEFKNGSFNQIGKELGEALSKNAGAEMTQLGAALSEMTTKLSSMHEKLEGSGTAANDQIDQAARTFTAASDNMSKLFSDLQLRIESTGTRLTESAETASIGAANQFAQATSNIQTAFDQMRGEIADISTKLAAGANAAAERNADVLARAADALETATSRTSKSMSQAIDDAVAKASEESAKAMSTAFTSFGAGFEKASAGLVSTLHSTAGRMEALALSIERSAVASDSHASKLVSASLAADGISTTLIRAASELQSAAAPIRIATESIGTALNRVQDSMSRQTEAATQNQTAIAMITDRLSQTSDSATKAWNDYRDRFENVDKSLASSLDQIKSASGDHATHLNEQVGHIDNALAKAVDKLSAALEPLTDLADQIEDLLGKMRTEA